jgi:SAM-dependent methyltransferase
MQDYVSGELVPMALAHNYYQWILRGFRQHLGKVVCEFGAGIGTFSSLLLEEDIHRLILVEPSANLLPRLRRRFEGEGRVWVAEGEIEAHADRLVQAGVETVVGVNVLEHIENDRRTLATIGKTLPAGGKLLLFVPALPALFGSLDEAFGHWRRYRKAELEAKVTDAGFQILDLRFMNFPGIVSWLVVGRILRWRTLSPRMVRNYDRWVVPVVAAIERRLTAPVGPSLMVIARPA